MQAGEIKPLQWFPNPQLPAPVPMQQPPQQVSLTGATVTLKIQNTRTGATITGACNITPDGLSAIYTSTGTDFVGGKYLLQFWASYPSGPTRLIKSPLYTFNVGGTL